MYAISWDTNRGFLIYFQKTQRNSQDHMATADYEANPVTIHRTAVLHEAEIYGTIEAARESAIAIADVYGDGFDGKIVEIQGIDLFKSRLEYGNT